MSPTADSVTERIDEMLKDDKNFSTRHGLRFMTGVMKEALMVIAETAAEKQKIGERLSSLEASLTTFLKTQGDKEKRAEDERNKWRWAIISPTLVLILAELFRWVMR
jgi:hypothetical protein